MALGVPIFKHFRVVWKHFLLKFTFQLLVFKLLISHSTLLLQSLSYVVAVIQWIMLCHKQHMSTCVIILWCIDVMSLTMSVSTMRFLLEIFSILKTIKNMILMINRTIHSCSLHVKFMKLAKGLFRKFRMN